MKLAEYLFARLHQLGVRDVLGVPGDFNLVLLDYVVPAGLNWIGNCNELNAGYAADGYARIRGLSALVTTFGVGELSAANAIAGAYAERAPVIHIVGTPSVQQQKARVPIHHTFIDGDFKHYARMAKELTVAQVDLCDPETAADLVDHAIQQCLFHSRPVYIQVPTDQLEVSVDEKRLQHPIVLPALKPSVSETEAVTELLKRIYAAKSILLFVDGETRSMGIAKEVNELIRATKLPTFTSQFGKGLVDETLPNVYGIYSADAGPTDFSEFWAQCDLVLAFGPHYSITNSYANKAIPSAKKTISFAPQCITLPENEGAPAAIWENVPIKSFLKAVVTQFDSAKLTSPAVLGRVEPSFIRPISLSSESSTPLTQENFYAAVQPLLRSGDVLLGETGTPAYSTRELTLPAGCSYLGATTWLSIGYMLPACFGAALARRALVAEYRARLDGSDGAPISVKATNETAGGLNERCVLFTGDGSLQMTVQEISTMIHHQVDVLIFVINNGGYTIERCLHGWRAPYNDIANWRYSEASSFFGAPEERRKGWRASTVGELKQVLDDTNVADGKGVRVVEIVLDKEDAPETLMRLTSRPPPK